MREGAHEGKLAMYVDEEWKQPRLFRVFFGDETLPSYVGIISETMT